MNIFYRHISLMIPVLFFFCTVPVFCEEELPVPPSTDDALDEELRYLQAETYVITASKIPENIKKSASSITVITDKQIQQMGAKHLSEVLQTVPGMYYHYGNTGTYQLGIRGDMRNFQNVILVMVNGHSINEGWTGAATFTHDTMILDNVKRIEVIRGPGSALYGANAFAGVVNVITKEAVDINGWELTAGGGSYDTQQYNLLYGKTHNDLNIVFNYNYFNTHGFQGLIERDALLSLPFFSLAPGRTQGDDEKYDVSLNLEYKGLTFDGRWVERERDLPLNVNSILTNWNVDRFTDYSLNVGYERDLREDLTLSGKVYRNHVRFRLDYQFWPPGVPVLRPWGIGFMKDGLINEESVKDNRTGFEIQTTYRMSESNTVVAGITYEEIKQYDPKRRSNYLLLFNFFPFGLTSVRDLSNIQNWNRSAKRNFKAFFMEDIWDITSNLRLTVGVRWDDYSDFGSEVSPRAGLTWEFKKGYDLKLLYGHAFRVPSFFEMYNRRFAAPGLDLDPETIDTYEISLGVEFTPSLSSRVTFFHNEGKDNLVALYEAAQNENKTRSQGIEVEARYDLPRGSYLSINYTYVRWISPHVNFRNWWAPRHLGNVMANIRLSRYLNYNVTCHIEDGFRRNVGDRRDDMSGFAVVNTTLIARKFLKGYENLELRGSIYNLFDKDYTSPDYTTGLPNDMPQPGRNFIVEVSYKF